jgi:uncharacterized membrane protein (UPF0127 family)
MIAKADNFLTRAVGLLATKTLPGDRGLWIVPCKDVHTWFMRFSIDVVFLGKDNRVLAIKEGVKPFRFVLGPKGTVSVLELASGMAVRTGIDQGDILGF